MAVLKIKHEPKCKLCRHPQRDAIDQLLELRSGRQADADGNMVTTTFLIARCLEMGVVSPNVDNLKNHWRRHCEVTTEEAIVKGQALATEALLGILDGTMRVDVNTDLDKLWAIGIAEIEGRISSGEKSGITPDILMRIAQEKNRRSHNESQDELLKALAGGVAIASNALAGVLRPAHAPVVIGEAEIIDVKLEIDAEDGNDLQLEIAL